MNWKVFEIIEKDVQKDVRMCVMWGSHKSTYYTVHSEMDVNLPGGKLNIEFLACAIHKKFASSHRKVNEYNECKCFLEESLKGLVNHIIWSSQPSDLNPIE